MVSDGEFLDNFPAAMTIRIERCNRERAMLAAELRPILEKIRDPAVERVHCCLSEAAVKFLTGLRYTVTPILNPENADGKTHVITW